MVNDRWSERIDKVTAAVRSEFGPLSTDQINFKPDENIWSIAQNLDHLVTINTSYEPVLKSVKDGTYQLPWIGKIGFMVRFLGNMVLQSVQPDRKRKMKTFPIWEPGQSNISGNVVEEFARQQENLKKLIRDASGLLDAGTIISSPANANIVYKLETAFDIIVAHEERHLEQMRELLPTVS